MSYFVEQDVIQSFLFEGMSVRGTLVRLSASYQTALSKHPYSPVAQGLLADALSVITLLMHTVKTEGRISLQAQGPGPITLLLTECTHQYHIRGLLTQEQQVLMPGQLADLFGPSAKMAITMRLENQPHHYQGIVPFVGDNLAQAIELYFRQSEQIPTRIYLAHDATSAVGLMLQTMPDELSSPGLSQEWQHVTTLADTLRPEELLTLPNREILYRLYHQENVRLFEPQPVSFRCSCSRTRMENVLISLGETELKSLLSERGVIDAYCEFCNHHYVFDAVDVHQLLADPVSHLYSNREH